jgi:hypothetical protein
MVTRLWPTAIALTLALVAAACRGGAAGRAAALPHPTDLAQWLALAVFVIGIWWVALKIFRG